MKRTLLVLAFVAMWQSVFAYDFSAVVPSGQRLYFNIVNGEVQVTFPGMTTASPWANYAKPTGSLVIPDSISSSSTGIKYPVTTIRTKAFYECSGLISVTIGRFITQIGNNAFSNCSGLTTVNFNADRCVSIGSYSSNAFAGCNNITVFSLGNNIKQIPAYLCYNKSNLTGSLIIPDSVTSIGVSAFLGCHGLVSVVIGDSVSHIGANAFAFCSGLISLTLSNSVSTIGMEAFWDCSSLTSVSIPHSVKSIGNRAFSGCLGLTTVNFNADSCTFVGTSLAERAFLGCTNISNFTFGDNVKVIPPYICYAMSGLTNIIIPNSVTLIGDSAFWGCGSLTSATIGTSVATIGGYAFANCSSLTSVIIPESTTNIYTCAFGYCNRLSSVTFQGRLPPYIGQNAFSYNATNRVFYVLCGSFNSYQSALYPISSSTILEPTATGVSIVTDISNPSYGMANILPIRNGITIACDSTAIIYATPNNGYHFEVWSSGSTNNPDTIKLIGDSSITAIFAPNQYTLTGAVNSSQRGTVDGVGIYNYGDTATLTAVPNYGYKFTRWGDYEYDNPRRVVVRQDKTYTAYFDYDQFDITVGVDDASHGYTTGGGRYDYMSSQTVRAYENNSYGNSRSYFAYWSDGSNDNPYTFTLTQDTTLTAHYYTLTATADSTGYVSQTKTGTLTVRLNASPNYGYHFSHWSNGSTANPDTLHLTGDSTVTAYFDRNTYTVSTFSNDDALGYTCGDVEGLYLDTIELSATCTAEHYHFSRWSDGNTDNPRRYVVEGNSTLTALFAIDTHTVRVTCDVARGTVSGGGRFTYGSACTVEAQEPYTGFVFHSWSNGVTANPYVFAVISDIELSAIFVAEGEEVYTVTVASADPEMGFVGGGGQALAGGRLTIRAQGYPGYRFLRWNDNNTDSVRTVTVTGNATYTAYFSETVGIEDVEGYDQSGPRLYPNPAHSSVTVTGLEPGRRIALVDLYGRTLADLRATSTELTIDVSALSPGTYFVRVEGLPAQKVVVIN